MLTLKSGLVDGGWVPWVQQKVENPADYEGRIWVGRPALG